MALKGVGANQPAMWKALRAQGIYRGHGPAPKAAFLYPGQGSQYVNMLRALRATNRLSRETFAEADRAMTPFLGKPLTQYIFVDTNDEVAIATGRRRPAPDGNHATRSALRRYRHHPAARCLRHSARYDNGPQPW